MPPSPLSKRSLSSSAALLAALAAAVLLAAPASTGPGGGALVLPGLGAPVQVVTDRDGVRHLVAEDDFDLVRASGFVHARDRFFQMDLTRRQVSGDLAELFGSSRLPGDIQARTIGLRRAAQRSLSVLTPRELALLQAYAEGVNAFLDSHPLPPEYAALELSQARRWDVVDSLSIGKAIAASLSLDIDVGPTSQLQRFVAAGIAQGFDGAALFFDDVRRSAPMDPASTVPDATSGFPFVTARVPKVDPTFLAQAAAGAERLRAKLAGVPLFAHALDRRDTWVGSNEWAVDARHAAGRGPIVANDPHLALDIPSTFYEWHLVVKNDPEAGPLDVSGVGFPGAPGVILGQNERITWGATTNPMDVSDVFLDELHVFQPACAAINALACIRSGGEFHRVDVDFASYSVNRPDDTILDNLFTASLPLEQRLIATVPFRSFGPVVDITNPGVVGPGGGVTTALVLQFTGFHATRELGTFNRWNRARNLADFLDGLADFDFGSQNWAYADAEGNLAYFSSAELPLRKDLEAGTVSGMPPGFVRDGISGANNWVPDLAHSQGQAIPYAILPFAEMPQTVNPANGFFVNANNDPAGTTLDNNPLNQMRPSKPSAIYYLNPDYDEGLRAGRITRLLRDHIAAGKKVSVQDMKRFQANTQQLDAELFTPFLQQAWDRARRPGAPGELTALAGDARLAEALGRLAQWDFSTPTGIPEGYDAHDTFGKRTPSVPKPEARASVAATLYNVWRGQAIRRVIDARLAALGLSTGSTDAMKGLFHLLSTTPFTGVGASGVDFFPEPSGLSAEDRRDVALLSALRAALDRLASDAFAPAYANSTNQDDYRWGKLHRITFDHPFLGTASIPPAAGFADVGPGLPGVARDGGLEVVNASGFSPRAQSVNEFRFGGGPVRRYVGQPRGNGPGPRIKGFNVMPGGPSGIPGDPRYATQLGSWLTADYHAVVLGTSFPSGPATQSETLVPAP